MPICTKCGTDVPAETQDGQDNSTFVCGTCQDKIDLPVWQKEVQELGKLERQKKTTVSQSRRLKKVDAKVKTLET